MSQLTRNVLSASGARLLSAAIAFMLFPFIAGRVGLAAFGLWLLLQSIGLLVSGVDFGMGTAVVRFVADRRAMQDDGALGKILSTALAFHAVLGLVSALAFAIVLFAIWGSLDIPSADQDVAVIMVVLATAGTLVLGLPLAVFRNVLSGLHRIALTNAILTVQLFVRAALIVSVLLLGFGILAVAIVDTAAVVGGGLACLVASRRLLPGVRFSLGDVRISVLKPMLRFSLQVFVLGAAALIILQTDNLILGAFLSLSAVTLYAGAYRFVQFTRDVTSAFMFVTIPEAARASALNEGPRLRDLLVRGTRYVNVLVLLIAVPGIVFAGPLLALWGGDAFREATGVLQLLFAGLIVNANHFMGLGLLTGMGRVKRLALYHVIWAAANLVISLLLVQTLGLVGVAIGTVAPIVILEPLYVRTILREVGVKTRQFVLEAVLPPLYGATLGGVMILALSIWWSMGEVLLLVIGTTLFVIVDVGCFLRLSATMDERRRVRSLARSALGMRLTARRGSSPS